MWNTLKSYWPFRLWDTSYYTPKLRYQRSLVSTISLCAERYDSIQLLLLAEHALNEQNTGLFLVVYQAYLQQKKNDYPHYNYIIPVQGNGFDKRRNDLSYSLRQLLEGRFYQKLGTYCEERGFEEEAGVYYNQASLLAQTLDLPSLPFSYYPYYPAIFKIFSTQLDKLLVKELPMTSATTLTKVMDAELQEFIVTLKPSIDSPIESTDTAIMPTTLSEQVVKEQQEPATTISSSIDDIVQTGVDTGRNQLAQDFILPKFKKSVLQKRVLFALEDYQHFFEKLLTPNNKYYHPKTIALIQQEIDELMAVLNKSIKKRDDEILVAQLDKIQNLSYSHGRTNWAFFGGYDTFGFANFRQELDTYLNKCITGETHLRKGYSIDEINDEVLMPVKTKAETTLKETLQKTGEAVKLKTRDYLEEQAKQALLRMDEKIEQDNLAREEAKRKMDEQIEQANLAREQANREREEAKREREENGRKLDEQIKQAQKDREQSLQRIDRVKLKHKERINSYGHIKQRLNEDENNLNTLVSDIEENLDCPITHQTMEEPMVTPQGHSYERIALTQWLVDRPIDPLTRVGLQLNELHPNRNLQGVIGNFHGLRMINERFSQHLRDWPTDELSDSSDNELSEQNDAEIIAEASDGTSADANIYFEDRSRMSM